MSRIATLAVSVILVAGAAVGGRELYRRAAAERAADTSAIPVAAAVEGTLERTVNSVGELKAFRSSAITAPYEGKVVKIVAEGARVKAGEPILWMDTDKLVQDLQEQEANLGVAQKDFEAAKEAYRLQQVQNEYELQAQRARVELAEKKYEDTQQKMETERILVERKISPADRLEETRLAMLSAGVELRNAKIELQKTEENLASNLRVKQTQIDKAQLEIDRIQRQVTDYRQRIEGATLKAPTDGEIAYLRIWKSGTSAKVAEGDTVWPRTNLLEIPDRSRMMAVIPVNELDYASVEVGQRATITLDALPGQAFSGTVERKSVVPLDQNQMMMGGGRRGGGVVSNSGSSGPKEFEVQVALDDNNELFYQGLTAAVRIEVGRAEKSVQVPLESLTVRDGKVGVVKQAGAFAPVEVALLNDRFAALKSGLSAGDKVYLRDPEATLAEARTRSQEALRLAAAAIKPPAAEQPAEGRRGRRPDGERRRGDGNAPEAGAGENREGGEGRRNRRPRNADAPAEAPGA